MGPYQDNADPVQRYSTGLVWFFVSLTKGRIEQAMGVFAVTACSVLLHLPLLPEGMRLWACYLPAHRMYVEKTITAPWRWRSRRCP